MYAELFQHDVVVIILLLEEKTREGKLFICVREDRRLIDLFSSNCFHCFGMETQYLSQLFVQAASYRRNCI